MMEEKAYGRSHPPPPTAAGPIPMSDRLRHRFGFRRRHRSFAALLTCAAGAIRGRRDGAVPRLAALLLAALAALGAGQAAAQLIPPTITRITLNNPATGDTFVQGETITATLHFSEPLRDNNTCQTSWSGLGILQLELLIGGATRQMRCPTNGNILRWSIKFTYTVGQDDADANGLSISRLHGGTIFPTADNGGTGNPVDYGSLPRIQNSPNHKVAGSAIAISAVNPSSLTERNVDGATIALSLTGTTFASGVTAASFALVPAVPGLSIANVAGAASGGTTATLTLAHAGGELPASYALAVRVLTAAHAGGIDLTTWTTIPVVGGAVALADPALAAAVERALGKQPGTLRILDMPALRTLNLDGAGISSLAGLDAALWLESLSLGGNTAAGGAPLDLSPLAGLTSLRTLLLSGTAVRDLSPLSGLSSLEQLWLDGNDLADISALAGLGSLIYLHLGDNRVADISPLAGLAKLRRLWLPNNMVADVSALAGLRALTRLDLSRNRIADASPLRGLTRLAWLRLGWNRLADVSGLVGHPGLADGGALGLRGNPLGAAALAAHIPALREAGASVVFGWAVPLFPSAADASGRSGVVRVLNRSDMDGAVLVEAVDEAGQTFGPVSLPLAAGAAARFDSADLENGNAAMGLMEGVGPPMAGSWRLHLWSALDIEVLAYVRTPDGFLTPAHGELPRAGDSLSAFLFNPASNRAQRSSLRVFNPVPASARMSVWGVDDAGRGRFAPGFEAPAGAPLALTAGQLERSRGAVGAGLGNGAGKWRLRVHAPWPLSASSWLASPSGHLSNLSSPPLRAAADEMLRLPLFPSAMNPAGREGFARVANMTAAEGMVEISAVDDAGVRAGPVQLPLAARATMHFNSDDLESGNAAKGLASGVGAPTKGAWRLELQSGTLALAAAAYVRHADGFVTSLHETAPAADGAARVAVFHPASSDGQRSLLRLANNGDEPAMATITGVDDAGATSEPLTATVPAGEALTLTAAQLEDGGEGLEGALGDGEGKWRLTVAFDNPLTVMSLLESPAGHLSNLSATARP